MANKPAQLYKGPLTLDVTPLGGSLYDLEPGGMQRLRREKDGIEDVIAELAESMPKFGAAAGISPDVYANFVAESDTIAKIREMRARVAKLAEVLEESEVWHEHHRENEISLMADAVKSTARRKDSSIQAPFEKLLKYNSQTADKAVKTRRKNKADAENQDGEEQEPAPTKEPTKTK